MDPIQNNTPQVISSSQAQTQPKPWSSVESNPDYLKMPVADQDEAKSQYFSQVVSKRPDFQQLSDSDKTAAASQFMNKDKIAADQYYNDDSSSKLEKQMTAGLYNHVAFGKDLVIATDPKAAKNIARTPDPQTWDEKFGRFVGAGLGILPAFSGGEAIGSAIATPLIEGAGAAQGAAVATGNISAIANASRIGSKAMQLQNTAKLAGGATALGVQGGIEASEDGKNTLQSIEKGALDAGSVFIGGKSLEAGASILANTPAYIDWTASRINNSVIKPQLKDFRFGRDPGGFLAKYVTSPDNTLHGWKSATEDAIDTKMQEAKDIISSKGDQTVNVQDSIDKIYGPAMDQAAQVGDEGLLKQLVSDRQSLSNKQIVVRDPETGEISIGAGESRNLSQLSLPDAIDLKRLIGKMPTNWTQGTETLSTLQSIRRQAYGAVRSATEDIAPELKGVNSDIADGISASNAMGRRMAIEQRQNMLGLYSVTGGTTMLAGLFSGNLGLATAGLAQIGADVVMKSPYLASRTAMFLSKLNRSQRATVMNTIPWIKNNFNSIMSSLTNITPQVAAGTNRIIGHLDDMDPSGIGELYGQPLVVNRPAPYVKTSQTDWPQIPQVPSPGFKDAQDAMTTYNMNSKIIAVTGIATSGAGVLAPRGDDKNRLNLNPASYTKTEEGFRGDPYTDTQGHKSIGYGFNMDSPAVQRFIPEEVKNGSRSLTQAEADGIFNKLYNVAKNQAIQFTGNDTWNTMSPKQQQAVTDMSYNLGGAKLAGFKDMKAALQNGDWSGASKEVLNSKYAHEVPNRARRNAILISRMA